MLSTTEAIALLPDVPGVRVAWLSRLPEDFAPRMESVLWLGFHEDIRRSLPTSQVLDYLISVMSANLNHHPGDAGGVGSDLPQRFSATAI